MIVSPLFNMLAVLLFIGVTYSAVIPEKERFRNEEWAEDYNLVEPPPAVLLFSRVFDHSKSKITPQNRLKSVIKALYQYDTMNNVRKVNDDKEVISSESSNENKSSTIFPEDVKLIEEQPLVETEIVLSSKSSETNDKMNDFVKVDQLKDVSSSEEQRNEQKQTTEIVIEPTEQTEQTTQKLEVLLEDFVDSIIHVPAHMEGDKAQKFTHSIRYGYGVPFHYNGL